MDDIRTEAQRERDRLAAEARREQERLANEAGLARARAAQEAQAAQDRIRKQQSEAERQAEALKAEAREAERLEQRKQDLPLTKPRQLGTKEAIADVEKQRIEIHAAGEKIRGDIEKALAEQIADITGQESAIKASIEAQRVENEARVQAWEVTAARQEEEWQTAVSMAETAAQQESRRRTMAYEEPRQAPSKAKPNVVVIGKSPTTTEVIVKDTATGEMYWKPGTPGQVSEATRIIGQDKQYELPYNPPAGISLEKPIPGSLVTTPIEGQPIRVYDFRGLSVLVAEAELNKLFELKGQPFIDKAIRLGIYDEGTKVAGEGILPGWQVKSLQRESPELFNILTTQGWDAYQKAFEAEQVKFTAENMQLKSGEWTNKTAFEALPPKMQEVAIEKGISAIDISKLEPTEQFKKMKEWELIPADAKYAGVNEQGEILVEGTSGDKEAWYQRFLTAQFGKDVAIGMIPIAGTWYFWNKIKPWERGVSIALDVISFIPFTCAVSAGVRSGQRLSIVLGRAALAEVKAPITAITHPIAATKAGIKPFITLVSPKRVPLAAAEIRSFILDIPVKEIGEARSAMQARDLLTEAAIRGEKPVIEVAGKKIELAKVAMQQKLEGLAVHSAPDVRPFLHGVEIKAGNEGLGLFVAPTINSRLTHADAFGRGFVPTPDVGIFEWTGRNISKIGKYSPQDIVKLDLPAIRSLNLADAKHIPADIAKPLANYIRQEKGTIVGSFSEWLKLDNAKRPHDIDLNFANPIKAREDIANIARQAGYKVQVKQSAVIITSGGKTFEIANVKGARVAFFKQHGLEIIPAKTIDGIQVIPLGEQYLRQGFGAIAAGEDIATFQKRTEHMLRASKSLRDLINETGLSERMKGALLIRDEKVLAQMQPSGKLHRNTAEIEQTIKAGIKLSEPSQVLQAYDATGDTLHLLVFGKPFTKAQIAKMKFVGALDTIKDIFRPAMTIDKKAIGLTDEITSLASGARTLKRQIKVANVAKDTTTASRLRNELAVMNSRARAIGRNIDLAYAGRTSLRAMAVSTGEYLDRLSYNELARRNPAELVRTLARIPRTDRARILDELRPRMRNKIEPLLTRTSRTRKPRRTREPRIRTSITRKPRIIERGRILPISRISGLPERIVPPREIPRITRMITPGLTRIPIPTGIPPRVPSPERPPRVPSPIKPPKPVPPIIRLPKVAPMALTPEQLKGSIAWKQGFIYKLIYPPYGEENIINTLKPIKGVRYFKGAKAAYRSVVRIGGKVPAVIHRDMGIQDITIKTSEKGQPRIAFEADIRQRTKVTPKSSRRSREAKRKIKRSPQVLM